MTERRPIIEATDLSLSYGDRVAFKGISLTVAEGTVLAIVGPSGCGKTSFLHTLSRLTDLVPSARATGRLRIGELDALSRGCDLARLRREVGTIFQKPAPFPLSIRANLELPLREHGTRDKRALAETVERVLTEVGLWEEVRERLDEPAMRLSGGQKQRLCIARALSLRPRVLLMDEPCSALDPVATARIEALIRALHPRYTVLIVTHNLAQARRVADRVAVFWVEGDAGVMVEEGPTEAVFTASVHPVTRAYVGGQEG